MDKFCIGGSSVDVDLDQFFRVLRKFNEADSSSAVAHVQAAPPPQPHHDHAVNSNTVVVNIGPSTEICVATVSPLHERD